MLDEPRGEVEGLVALVARVRLLALQRKRTRLGLVAAAAAAAALRGRGRVLAIVAAIAFVVMGAVFADGRCARHDRTRAAAFLRAGASLEWELPKVADHHVSLGSHVGTSFDFL